MITLHLKSQQEINRAQRWYTLLSITATLTFLTTLFPDSISTQVSVLFFVVMVVVLVFSMERCRLLDPLTTNQLEQFIKDLSTIDDPKLIEQVQQGLDSSLVITKKAAEQIAIIRLELTERAQLKANIEKLKTPS